MLDGWWLFVEDVLTEPQRAFSFLMTIILPSTVVRISGVGNNHIRSNRNGLRPY